MSNFAAAPNRMPLNIAYQKRWEQDYKLLLDQFLKVHDSFDGSAVAAWMRKQGIADPIHHNKWGSQLSYYARQGWCTATKERGVPSGNSHLQTVRIWKSNRYVKPATTV